MRVARSYSLEGITTLVLNRSYLPVHVTSVKRAFSLLYRGVAKAVDSDYRTFPFEAWLEQPTEGRESAGLVNASIRIPRVILLASFDRFPRREVRFSRANIFVRDGSTCQYCGSRQPANQLNLDHVIPRTQGGLTTWENVVCCCISCNRSKGGRRPDQARMRLRRKPVKPNWTPFVARNLTAPPCAEWRPFLGATEGRR